MGAYVLTQLGILYRWTAQDAINLLRDVGHVKGINKICPLTIPEPKHSLLKARSGKIYPECDLNVRVIPVASGCERQFLRLPHMQNGRGQCRSWSSEEEGNHRPANADNQKHRESSSRFTVFGHVSKLAHRQPSTDISQNSYSIVRLLAISVFTPWKKGRKLAFIGESDILTHK
jgi:hypothetical protein